jgi:hypothetical protein
MNLRIGDVIVQWIPRAAGVTVRPVWALECRVGKSRRINMSDASVTLINRSVPTSAAVAGAISLLLTYVDSSASEASRSLQAHPRFAGIHITEDVTVPGGVCRMLEFGDAVALRALANELYRDPNCCGAPTEPPTISSTVSTLTSRVDPKRWQWIVVVQPRLDAVATCRTALPRSARERG